MLSKSVYLVLVGLCLSISSCQTSEAILQKDTPPTELTARFHQGKVVGNLEGERLRDFARKLAMKNASSPSEKRQFAKAEIVDSHLDSNGDFVYLVTKFQSQPAGSIVKVSTGLQSQKNSTHTISL